MAEEFGVIGTTLTIVLFGIVVFKAIAMGPRASALGMPFQGLVSTGIGLTLGLQAFINMGVNTGLLPTKGLTLPLISYGRTSIVVTLVALGLLARGELRHEVDEMPGLAQPQSFRRAQRAAAAGDATRQGGGIETRRREI